MPLRKTVGYYGRNAGRYQAEGEKNKGVIALHRALKKAL
jgi:hypothetical protein